MTANTNTSRSGLRYLALAGLCAMMALPLAGCGGKKEATQDEPAA